MRVRPLVQAVALFLSVGRHLLTLASADALQDVPPPPEHAHGDYVCVES